MQISGAPCSSYGREELIKRQKKRVGGGDDGGKGGKTATQRQTKRPGSERQKEEK